MSRKKNSAKNIIVSLLSNIITIALGIITQAFFVRALGKEQLGLNGLFGNIIAMLSIAELGIGSAITYTLYEPIKDHNREKIKSIMRFYKKSYQLIGIIVLTIGIVIMPFIDSIIDTNTITQDINIYVVYILFLAETTLSYFATYKRCIFSADQKEYVLNIVKIIYSILLNGAQILVLVLTKNFYLFLLLKVILKVLENIAINILANKKYAYLKEDAEKLNKKTERDIMTKVKALFFHKIGSFIVTGTDNIIIAKFINLTTVGVYSNYNLIITAIQKITCQALSSITGSIGNLLVTETTEKQFDIFKKIRYLNFCIATFVSTVTFVVIEPFIVIWIGNDFLLDRFTLIILVINLFMMIMRSSYSIFKEAAGIYREDRFVPLIEATVNIIASIILVKLLGLPGVFIGTFISGLILWCYSYPKYVYKNIFKKKYLSYIKETLTYILVSATIAIVISLILNNINFENIILNLIIKLTLSIVFSILLIICLTFKTDNFKYYIKIIKTKLKK